MCAVTGQQDGTIQRQRGCKHRLVLFRQQMMVFGIESGMGMRVGTQLIKAPFKLLDAEAVLAFQVASGFGDHVGVDDEFVTEFDQLIEESSDGAVGLGVRKQDIGIQEDTHGLMRSALVEKLGQLRFRLVELLNTLISVNFDR